MVQEDVGMTQTFGGVEKEVHRLHFTLHVDITHLDTKVNAEKVLSLNRSWPTTS